MEEYSGGKRLMRQKGDLPLIRHRPRYGTPAYSGNTITLGGARGNKKPLTQLKSYGGCNSCGGTCDGAKGPHEMMDRVMEMATQGDISGGELADSIIEYSSGGGVAGAGFLSDVFGKIGDVLGSIGSKIPILKPFTGLMGKNSAYGLISKGLKAVGGRGRKCRPPMTNSSIKRSRKSARRPHNKEIVRLDRESQAAQYALCRKGGKSHKKSSKGPCKRPGDLKRILKGISRKGKSASQIKDMIQFEKNKHAYLMKSYKSCKSGTKYGQDRQGKMIRHVVPHRIRSVKSNKGSGKYVKHLRMIRRRGSEKGGPAIARLMQDY